MKTAVLLRWTARAWGVASTLLLIAFALGGGEHLRMTAAEAVGFLFFPLGVIAGFAVALRRELAGGLIAVGNLALFYCWLFARDGRLDSNPYFVLFAAPGFLHVAGALLAGREGRCANMSNSDSSRVAPGHQDARPGAPPAPTRGRGFRNL